MNKDININQLRTNCFRQSKIPGEFMLQMRVPGGTVDAKYLSFVQSIAEKWGNGSFHIGTRQTFDITGIKYESIADVNNYIAKYMKEVEVYLCDVDMEINNHGYPTIGSRNIMGCIGNRHCIKANIDTTSLARRLEKEIFPSHYHIKLSIAGCPNDCAKAHFQDFGIIGVTRPIYLKERCIGCGRCVKVCTKAATRVLKLVDHKIQKDACCCVGCGECVTACPASAWVRPNKKFYRIMIGGRTGKQTPRMGKMFLNWVTEDVVFGVIKNWQKFSDYVMGGKPEYLHGGHLIDRAGYDAFKKVILDGVKLNPEALVAQRILWSETEYRSNFNLKPLSMHPVVPPRD